MRTFYLRRLSVVAAAMGVAVAMAALMLPGQALAQSPGASLRGKLLASDGVADDVFGRDVAVSGNTLVVGAPGVDPDRNHGEVGAGAAYVFERDAASATGWRQVAELTASDRTAGDIFGASVGISADTIIVGAMWNDERGEDAGAAYIFERNRGGPNAWGQAAKLTASDARAGAWFGSVAISGTTAIVGALGADAAYLFERDAAGVWRQIARIVSGIDPCAPQPPEAGCDPSLWVERFGTNVAIDGGTAIVGGVRPGFVFDPTGRGNAHIFARNQGGTNKWGKVKTLDIRDPFGDGPDASDVAISGDTVVVGSAHGLGFGAWIFQRNQGGANRWGEVASLAGGLGLTESDAPAVAINGDIAVVGSAGADRADAIGPTGLAHVFSRHVGGTNRWGRVVALAPADAEGFPHFGEAVAIQGQEVVAGAPDAGVSSSRVGAAYVCELDVLNAPDVACRRTQELVNRLVSLPITSTSCCIAIPGGTFKFTIRALLTNTSQIAIRNPYVEVAELTALSLLNADFGPGGVGARLTPDVGDGVLAPGESVAVTFRILLASRSNFRFVVDLRGDPER
jgi:hypothetical protein